MIYYLLLLLAVGAERIAELRVALRNGKWSLAGGGIESGAGHYPVMVAMHTALLIAPILEVALLHRPFIPALGWTMVALVVAGQALRWWCIRSLGKRWNTRIIVIPGLAPVTSGPYRWFRHPNYVAVVVEIFALPLVHSAWITAVVFSVANAGMLSVRIRAENAALARATVQVR